MQPVVAVLEQAVAAHAFPGAVFGVAHRGRVLALEAVGRFTYEPESPRVTPETVYDLASLTKVVATTAMAMLLWQEGVLDLECPLGDILPGFVIGDARQHGSRQHGSRQHGARHRVTLRMLLAHSSGLPAYSPLYRQHGTPAGLLRAVLHLPLLHPPGSSTAYSDPGFILLGKALEVLAGVPMPLYCRSRIFDPLGMAQTCFCPAPGARLAIPPTEKQNGCLAGIVQGVVHDENCYTLGGASGHAGLFAGAHDVLRFAEAMLQPLRARKAEQPGLFTEEAVRRFTRRVETPEGSSRALGWDTPSTAGSSFGMHFHPGSFGHLGFTGTSLWVDPVDDAAVVLLTNRTFPTRDNDRIREVRPRLHDAVREALRRTVRDDDQLTP